MNVIAANFLSVANFRRWQFLGLICFTSLLAHTTWAVTGQNDAPVLDVSKSPILNSEFQDVGAPVGQVGTLVSRLADFSSTSGQIDNVSDQDEAEGEGTILTGIAVTAADGVNGTWYYSLNSSTWTALGTPSASSARLLPATARLYFQPTASFTGTATITFRAWDRTTGTSGGTASTFSNGNTTAFSTATDSASVTIVPDIAFRSAASAKSSGTASTSIVINRPTGSVTGDVLLAGIVFDSNTASLTAPTGWTLIRKTISGSQTLITYRHAVDPLDGSSYTWTASASVNFAAGMAAFSGASTTDPINAEFGNTTASSTTHTAPSVTPTLRRTMLVTWHAFASAATWTPPSGMTEFVDSMDAVAASSTGVSLEGNYFFESTSAATGTKAAVASNNADVGAVDTIALRPLNNAPVLDATDIPTLGSINEDAGSPSGAVGFATSRLVGLGFITDFMGNVADMEADAVVGVAIIGLDKSQGNWFYSTNHSTWQTLPAASDAGALLLSGWLYFQPNTNFSGTISNAITFRAWDMTAGISGTFVPLILRGASTAYSTESDTASLSVVGVNDAPTATNLSAAETYTQDIPLNLTDIVVDDVDNTNLTATLVLSNPNAGRLNTATSGNVTSTYNAGTGTWSAAGAITNVNALLAGVTFTPAAGFKTNFTIATAVSDGIAPAVTGSKVMTGIAADHSSTLLGVTISSNQFSFLLNGRTGSVYQIQTSVDLTNWFPWQTYTNTSGSTAVSDTTATNPMQFYRSVFVP